MSREMHGQPPLLLSIPPEIRLKIYRHLLLASTKVYMQPDVAITVDKNHIGRKRRHHMSNRLFPVILRTCRLIHHEALPILYTKNMFSILHVNGANSNTAIIRRAYLAIGIPYRGMAAMEQAVRLAPFLDKHPDITHLTLLISPNLDDESDVQDVLINTFLRTGYSGKLVTWPRKTRRANIAVFENVAGSGIKPTEKAIPMYKTLQSLVEAIASTQKALPELSRRFGAGTRDWEKRAGSIQLYLALQKRMAKPVDLKRVNSLFKMEYSR